MGMKRLDFFDDKKDADLGSIYFFENGNVLIEVDNACDGVFMVINNEDAEINSLRNYITNDHGIIEFDVRYMKYGTLTSYLEGEPHPILTHRITFGNGLLRIVDEYGKEIYEKTCDDAIIVVEEEI